MDVFRETSSYPQWWQLWCCLLEKDEALGLLWSRILFIKPRITKVQNRVAQWTLFKSIDLELSSPTSKWQTLLALRSRNLKVDILTSTGKTRSDSKYVSIILNNHFPAFKNFAIIFYSIPLLIKAPICLSLEDVVSGLIQHQLTLRNFRKPPPRDKAHSKATSSSIKHESTWETRQSSK